MLSRCETALAEYIRHIQGEFIILPENGGCRLVTPFTRPDGGSIELQIVEKPNREILLTDECTTADYLFVNGLTLEENESLLRQAAGIARRYHVEFDASELKIILPVDSIGSGIHNLVSAVLAVGELINKRRHRTINTFDDEVENFLVRNEIPIAAHNFTVLGQSAEHTIRFYVNGHYNWLVEPVTARRTTTAKKNAKLIAFKWMDIANAGHQFVRTVILDDTEHRWDQLWSREDIVNPIENYSDLVFRWSDINRLPDTLRNQL